MPSIILHENTKETKNKLNAIDRLQRNKFSQVALYMYACYCLNILCQPYHVQGTLNYFLCAFEKLKCKTSHFLNTGIIFTSVRVKCLAQELNTIAPPRA